MSEICVIYFPKTNSLSVTSLHCFGNTGKCGGTDTIRPLMFAVSLAVTRNAAVEEFFYYGERGRHYWRTGEALKNEGWQFFQLSGPYSNQIHVQAYPVFAAQVEEFSREEVETYITQVVRQERRKPTSSTA